MPTTYEPIATTTLGSAAASITFSSIPTTYTDLRVVANTLQTATTYVGLRLNSVSTNTYSYTELYGTGSSSGSARGSNITEMYLNSRVLPANTPGLVTADIFSYAGSTFKTVLSQFSGDNNGSGFMGGVVNLSRNTTAVSSLYIYEANGGTFAAGSTFTMYGIKNA